MTFAGVILDDKSDLEFVRHLDVVIPERTE